MVADVAVFVVPCVRRAERRNDINLDTLVGIRRQVADLLFRVEVSYPHVPENAVTPLRTSLNWHHVRELIQTHFFPVIPSNQVFPPQEEFSRLVVFYGDLFVRREVVPEHLAEMPGRVLVVITRNIQDANRSDLCARFDSISDADEALPEYLRVSVVGAIDQGSLGRLLGGPVEVQEIIAYRQNDLFDLIRLDALDHHFNCVLVIACRDFQIVVIGLGLLVPTEFAEVAIVQAELDQVFSGSLASRFDRFALRHPLDKRKDAFLDRLGGFASELDGDLSAGNLPQRLDAVFVDDGFSLASDLPSVDFDLSDFPNIEIDFGVGDQFLCRGDLVSVVNKISGVVGEHR